MQLQIPKLAVSIDINLIVFYQLTFFRNKENISDKSKLFSEKFKPTYQLANVGRILRINEVTTIKSSTPTPL